MDSLVSSEVARQPEVEPLIRFDGVSKWYGKVIGVNNLTVDIFPGVTGLLGPNGAGKSTFLQLATGQLSPSQGTVTVLGQRAAHNADLNRFIALCPEQDAFYEWKTGWEFVLFCARLAGLGSAAKACAEHAIELVRMTEHRNRPIRGYSKGMRQRIKLAQALVHDPKVVFLDEPLTGTDPVARHELVEVMMAMGRSGRTVVVSSHILHEVQGMTDSVVLLNHGRLVAQGKVREIRDLIDKHPHRIVLITENYRKLASVLVDFEDVEGLNILAGKSGILVETRRPDLFYSRLPKLVDSTGLRIDEVYSDDDNLESVFKYLVSR